MLVLIWAALLVAAKSETGTSWKGNQTCDTSITLSKENITAEAGLCVAIPCSFTGSKPKNIDLTEIVFISRNVQGGSKELGAVLDPDLAKKNNCSIIINDLIESDYKIRVKKTNEQCTYLETTVIVKALSQKPNVTFPPLTERQQTTLTCTAPGHCSGSPPTFIWTWRGSGGNISEIAHNTSMQTVNLSAVTQEHSSTLTFIPSDKHHGTKVTCKVSFKHNLTTEETVTLNVNYVKTPKITGNACMKEGDTLSLTCSVESYPQSTVTWSKLDKYLQNGTQTTSLVIPNVTAEHSGQYICTAQQPNSTQTVNTSTTVMFCPKILNGSGCINQSDVLTCVCISQGAPLPSITWPLFENHTQYSLITTVSGSTVNSTITLRAKYNNTSIECVSSSGALGEVRRNLTIRSNKPEQIDLYKEVWRIVTQLETIIAFVIGVVLTATICCLTRRCCRKKQRNSRNLSETLEMVTSQDQPADAGQAMKDPTHQQEAPQGRNENGAQSSEAVVTSGADGDRCRQLTDADYASINYSLLKKKRAEETEKTQEIPETEYAEIKRENKEEVQEDGGEESQMLKEEEEEEATLGGDEETIRLEEEGGEGVALYSNVEAVIDEEG